MTCDANTVNAMIGYRLQRQTIRGQAVFASVPGG